MNEHSRQPHKRRWMHWQHTSIALLLTGAAVSCLYINHRFNKQIDLSANARHSLADASIDTVKALSKPLEIVAVLGPDPVKRDAVNKLISRYQKYKSDMTLEFVNPETQPAKVRELEASAGGELILTVGDRQQRLQNLSERSVTTAMSRLSRVSERKIRFVVGHDERDSTQDSNADFGVFGERMNALGLLTSEISLVSEPRIPDDTDLLVIAAPTSRYFPGEVASIIDFIGRGGNLLWMIDEQHHAGLSALSMEFGIDPMPGIVIDASSASYGADSPTFAVLDRFPKHTINEGISNPILMPGATALYITPLAGQITSPLLQSGVKSWTELGDIAGAVKFDSADNEQQGPLLLGATIERDKTGSASISTTSGQRIAVIGDADWLASQWIGNGSNMEYAERLLNWLTADDQLLAFGTQTPRDGIIDPSPKNILMLGGGFLFLLPLLFGSIATWLWHRQRNG